MSPGAKVNWSHTPSGGYGFSQQVAGVVVRLTAKRATIRVARRLDSGEWGQEVKSVSLDKLTPRTSKCSELGE